MSVNNPKLVNDDVLRGVRGCILRTSFALSWPLPVLYASSRPFIKGCFVVVISLRGDRTFDVIAAVCDFSGTAVLWLLRWTRCVASRPLQCVSTHEQHCILFSINVIHG